ncbi:hypothetical protein BKA70DRAFT_1220286 [Coprinopsis sp. MPI-PUGE-AT-0042]|nr:hypothetical protein BKA70DRAFT_1220286 [Coprinopsis sp. MPI-PUGE-AT-0042]
MEMFFNTLNGTGNGNEMKSDKVFSFEASGEDPCFNLFNPNKSGVTHSGLRFNLNTAADQASSVNVNMDNTENVVCCNDAYYQAGGGMNEGSNLMVFHDGAATHPGFAAFPTQNTARLDDQDLALFFPEIMGTQAVGYHQPGHPGISIDPTSTIRGPGESVTNTNMRTGDATRDARLVEMQTLIETQRRQIYELNSRSKKLQRRAEVFRDKAMTYRALYSQQQLVSEQLMSSIVQLRDLQNRPHATIGPPSPT